MGNDGGSIPKRDELVKIKQKKKEAEKEDENRDKWDVCAISKEPLLPPIVTCLLGYLYNKEAILTALLDSSLPSEFSHISSLKDLIAVNFTENPHPSPSAPKYICPITKVGVCGYYHKFMVMKGCGCVIANTALKELGDDKIDQCPNCSTPLPPSSPSSPLSSPFIQLNPPKELRATLRALIPPPSKKTKKTKKTKKSKKSKEITIKMPTVELPPELADQSEIKEKGNEEVGGKRKRKEGEKKVKNAKKLPTVEELMPKHSNPDIYRSLFLTSTSSTANPSAFI